MLGQTEHYEQYIVQVQQAGQGGFLGERVPAELNSHAEQPEGEGKAHSADWDARSEAGTDHATEDASHDQVDEQRGIQAGAMEVKRAANDGEAEAEGKVGSDDAANVERSETKESERTERSGARG